MSASDRAYAYAKERILDGRYPPGEMLSEGEVAEPTGLSRTPVREAFLRLQAEGLLRLFPKRGALVVPVSSAEVESVMETRLVIERFALERALANPVAISEDLRAGIETQELLVSREDRQGFVEADREFHRILVAAARNPILLELHDSMRDRQTRMGLAAIAQEAGRMQTILSEHRALAEALSQGRSALALELLDRHLDGTLRALRAIPAPVEP